MGIYHLISWRERTRLHSPSPSSIVYIFHENQMLAQPLVVATMMVKGFVLVIRPLATHKYSQKKMV